VHNNYIMPISFYFSFVP